MKKIISNSEEETKLIGRKFAKDLKKGDVIVLTGDLGSGKTKFTEGVLQFFGLENEISSPTFNIVKGILFPSSRIKSHEPKIGNVPLIS